MQLNPHRAGRVWMLGGLILFLAGLGRAADVRVVGSDLLGLEFSQALYACSVREGIPLAVALDGSRPGYDQLTSGRADLGLLTLPAGENPDPAWFTAVPLAWHRVVVIVAAATPLDRVTLADLAAVFGADVPVSYNRWGDLGLRGEWEGRPVTALAAAQGAGLSEQIFRRLILQDRPLKSPLGRYTSAADLAFRLEGDGRVLALAAALPPQVAGLKLLPVAVRAEDPAFSPTPENLQSGDYPLRLALLVVFRRTAALRVLPVVRFILSEEVARVLERAELVPAPMSVRRQHALALEKP